MRRYCGFKATHNFIALESKRNYSSRIPDADALTRIDRFLKGNLRPNSPRLKLSNMNIVGERETSYDSFVYPPKSSVEAQECNDTNSTDTITDKTGFRNSITDTITESSKKILNSATSIASDVATNVTEKSINSALDTIRIISKQVNDEKIDISVNINIGIIMFHETI